MSITAVSRFASTLARQNRLVVGLLVLIYYFLTLYNKVLFVNTITSKT